MEEPIERIWVQFDDFKNVIPQGKLSRQIDLLGPWENAKRIVDILESSNKARRKEELNALK